MANPHRGEISVMMGDGDYTLSLSLGALAELEAAFEVDGFEQVLDLVFAQGKPLAARTVLKFLTVVMIGCGYDVNDGAIKRDVRSIGTKTAIEAIQQLLEASGLVDKPKEADAEADAPLERPANAPEPAGSNG